VALVPPTNTNAIGNHAVAESAMGQIAAVWEQATGVQARIRTGAKWSPAVALGDTQSTINLFDLAMSPAGETVAVLKATPAAGGSSSVQSTFYSGGFWSAPVNIPAGAGQNVLAARVRYDNSGQATLVWTESDGTRCTVRVATGVAANGWSAPASIGTGCYNLLQLAVNNRGDAVLALGATVVPPPGSRAGSPAMAAFRPHGGNWSTIFDVGSTGVGNGPYQTAPSVAIAPNGAAVLLLSDANVGVKWSRKSATANSWSATTPIDGAEPAVPTTVAIDAKGNALAVYPSYYSNVGPAPLMASFLPVGSFQWDPAQTITDPSSDIAAFQLETTPAGSFVAGWIDQFAVGGASNATATLGISMLPQGSAAWTTIILDSDYSFVSPPAESVTVAAASSRSTALWNTQTRTGGLPLKTSTARLP
jgi:hypothetical protein